ncbi:uncharacterized protein LOC129585522 isoform X2 [Paramacrobiotus metropolitanus]|uniref:uncharacterized protein LOC129585522 isoform X2 n=1 Tax=Paramacrobiotus metropolitanus TaxID=2943436 RepID=UPI002446015D|nr:uncharacterized protein LOC129585522 isoform X2 [Paramacrobiotus metropolitanus]
MRLFSALLAAVALLVDVGEPASYRHTMEERCGSKLLLSYSTKNLHKRGGELRFQKMPPPNCNVTIGLFLQGSELPSQKAIYLNVVQLHLGSGRSLAIVDKRSGHNILFKHNTIRSAPHAKKFLPSVAHIRSIFQEHPSLMIVIKGDAGASVPGTSYFATIEYTILTKRSSDMYYCQPLDGFIPKAMCDDNQRRISCPVSYSPNSAVREHNLLQSHPCNRNQINLPPTLIDTVSLVGGQSIGTVGYFLSPLAPTQLSYRLLLGPLTLVISDRNVELVGDHADDFDEVIMKTPAHSLIHPNATRLTHWVSFSSRSAGDDAPPFIKFGHGYQMVGNILYHFRSKSKNNHDPTLRQIRTISLGDHIPLFDKMKLKKEPVLVDLEPIIIPNDQLTLEHLASEKFYMSPNSCPIVSGLLSKVLAAKFTQDHLDAITFSLKTPGCVLHSILQMKQSKSLFGNANSSYIRIPLRRSLLISPGQDMVLEVWPARHCSPVHDHGNSTAVIKILQGSLKSEWYNPIVNGSYEPPELIKAETVYAGNITWMRSDLYQTHKLINEDDHTPAISLQVYRYEEGTGAYNEDFFYYKKGPDDPYLGAFFPSKDIDIKEIIHKDGKVMKEYLGQRCLGF